jgi:hypothetical protein
MISGTILLDNEKSDTVMISGTNKTTDNAVISGKIPLENEKFDDVMISGANNASDDIMISGTILLDNEKSSDVMISGKIRLKTGKSDSASIRSESPSVSL